MIKKFIKRFLKKGSTLHHISTLVSGAALGQLAVFLALPVLSRLYTPEDFGVLAVFASILGIIGPISGLRYELAIPLPQTNGSAVNILVLSLFSVVFSSLFIIVLILLWGKQIPEWLNIPSITPYIWLLPVGILLAGFYQSFTFWAIRRSNFNCIARTKVQQGVGSSVLQVGMGISGFGVLGLILGHIIGQSAGLFELIRGARRDIQLSSRINWQRIKQRARRYQKFPIYTTWSSLANSSSTLLPPILFAALFSAEVAGMFMLAQKVIQVPMTLIGNAVSQVFISQAVKAKKTGNLGNLVTSTFSRLLQYSIIPVLALWYFIPEVLIFILGDTWFDVGIYAQLMMPWLILQLCVSTVSHVVSVVEQQVGLLFSQLIFLAARVGIIILTAYLGFEAKSVIESFIAVSVLLYLGHYYWICRILNIDFKGFIKSFNFFAVRNNG